MANASIVDGDPASIGEFPFQVALYNPREGAPAKGFFCGGVIIGPTRVATAAHCLLGEDGKPTPPAELEVLAGSAYLEPVAPGSVRDPVASATVDPAYSPAASDYDIGLLVLAHPLWSGPTPALGGGGAIAPLVPDIAQAAARTAEASPAAAPAGEGTTARQALVSGWGDLTPQPGGTPTYPLRLRSARVTLVPTALCEEAYARIEQPITPRMLCAGGGGEEAQVHPDSCYGDSGGPIVAPGPAGGSPAGDVLLGLVDFGNGCGQPGYPGVYVRIADPAVAHFLGAGAPVASAGGVHRGVCPVVRAGHGHRHGRRRADRRHVHSRRPVRRARRCAG
ncbi:MAG TPA: serine protease [Solirubrobacteraceae bacterium]|nr:serine protease [Solirubrobacteraceae bacterium]